MTEPTVLGTFDLAAEIDRFQPGDGASGRRAETLVKTDRLRLVLVTMRAGATLAEHTAPGPVTIQPVRGRFVVTAAAREDELGAGQLIALAAGVHHTVRAIDGGAFLLTIAWPAPDHASPADDAPATNPRD